MRFASALECARQALGFDAPWHADLHACYDVTPAQARALGQRGNGRRPDFPAGPKGQTYEEVWASRPRESAAEVIAFYDEIGSWPVFRQVYRHRYHAWPKISTDLPAGGRLIEYGCGVAPVTWWLMRRRADFHAVLVDVRGQALTFGVRRLRQMDVGERVTSLLVTDERVPQLPPCDVALVLETLEHVPHPLAVITTLLAALRPGGVLYEDFYLHSDPSPADLASAREERPAVYTLLQERCQLLGGRHWDNPEGGGTRRWRRR
jgi:SAM-dependent methyltransferase